MTVPIIDPRFTRWQIVEEDTFGAKWLTNKSEDMTPESKVKDKVKRILTDMGVYWMMPNTGGFGNSGYPDFLCCINGRFLAVECKAGNNRPTALQLREHDIIRAAGGVVLVINENNYDRLAVEVAVLKAAE